MPACHHVLFPLFSLFLTAAYAQQRRNVTIDDTSSLISYTPDASWLLIVGDMSAGGSHRLAMSSSAFATITYTFASFYFMSPKWPYRVSTQLTLDGQQTRILILQDNSVPIDVNDGMVRSSVVGYYEGTTNIEHTIRVSVPPGDPYAVVDMFIFEVIDPASSTSLSTSSSSTQDATATAMATSTTVTPPPSNSAGTGGGNSSSSGTTRPLTIALGVVGPICALLLLFFVWWFCLRRKKHQTDYPTSKPVVDPNISDYLPSDPSSASWYGETSEIGGRYASVPMSESGGYGGGGAIPSYGQFAPYIPPTHPAPISERMASRPPSAYQLEVSVGHEGDNEYNPYNPEHQALWTAASTTGATVNDRNVSYREGLASLAAATAAPLQVRNKSGPSRPQTGQSTLEAPDEELPGYSPGEYKFLEASGNYKGDSFKRTPSRSQPNLCRYAPGGPSSLEHAPSTGLLGQSARGNRQGAFGSTHAVLESANR
ncbi:hypothetical protein NLJ89_g9311 [Agrocybe chaxingu]|uniref:Uncharacterized protein n=1 Tax=Agrocybe chaxingu TaxID=84603 RepID=A0A9W8MPZ6_9AGAR|nr:hypothetical protein NLJ89_g9311 [Agrocybe chaxingu]